VCRAAGLSSAMSLTPEKMRLSRRRPRLRGVSASVSIYRDLRCCARCSRNGITGGAAIDCIPQSRGIDCPLEHHRSATPSRANGAANTSKSQSVWAFDGYSQRMRLNAAVSSRVLPATSGHHDFVRNGGACLCTRAPQGITRWADGAALAEMRLV
jgi:hypothetical protein